MYLIVTLFLIGLYTLWGAIAQPKFFWESRPAKRARSALGDKGTRILYCVLALVFIIAGIVFGVMRLWEKQADELYENGQYEQGLAKYQELFAVDKNNIVYLNGVAYGNYLLENYADAEHYAQLSIAVQKEDNYDGYMILSWVQESNGDLEEAATTLEEFCSIEEDYVYGLSKLGDIYEQMGEWDKAIDSYHKALELDQQYGEVYMYISNIYYNLEMYADELEVLKQMLNNDAVLKDKTLLETEALINYNMGVTYYVTGQYEDSIKHLNEAVSADSNDADAWYYLASCHAILEQEEASLKALEKVFELDSSYIELAIEDVDLVTVAKNPKFQEIIAKYNS